MKLKQTVPALMLLTALTLSGCAATSATMETSTITTGRDIETDIRRMLAVSGSAEVSTQVIDSMFGNFKQMSPNVPAEFWEEFKREFTGDEMFDLLIPIYARHMTHEDIIATIDFYESPAGQRMVASLPKITEESFDAGQKWGKEVAIRVFKKLVAEGYMPPEVLEGL